MYRILSQLIESRLALFPVILTQKCTCDMAVVSFLRGWTRGNSPSALQNAILEIHSEEWMRKQLRYIDDWRWYRWVYFSYASIEFVLTMIVPPQPRSDCTATDHSFCACRPCTICGDTKCSVRMLWNWVTALYMFACLDTCRWLKSMYAKEAISAPCHLHCYLWQCVEDRFNKESVQEVARSCKEPLLEVTPGILM